MTLKNNRVTALDSKKTFFRYINKYYSERNKGEYSEESIKQLSNILTEYYYEQYKEFRKEHPKSLKRYSTLKLRDLEHPFAHDKVILFATENYKSSKEQVRFCSLIFNMSEEDFLNYKKNRQQFHDMF